VACKLHTLVHVDYMRRTSALSRALRERVVAQLAAGVRDVHSVGSAGAEDQHVVERKPERLMGGRCRQPCGETWGTAEATLKTVWTAEPTADMQD
jgi:hypothetical protein